MFISIQVIGCGCVGSVVVVWFESCGVDTHRRDTELVLLCVPNSTIPDATARVAIGPWIAHVNGATRLATLNPHLQRFTLHPLQTFTRDRGTEQLDNTWTTVTSDSTKG